jgi:hypothetical protein
MALFRMATHFKQARYGEERLGEVWTPTFL